ncbi:hypothetical protein VNO77_15429 [Canavalia gladiata]|uniref:HTH three-helical bundle domain-containing protein n=1 Tax=Canavalia gladiata TaxID=3824 RepID=A0AAN9QP75_CANGL
MSSFPSSEERTVASSLLLLHTTSPSPSHSGPKFQSDSNDPLPERTSSKRFRESSVSDKSSSSSLTNDDGNSSEEEIKSPRISFSSAIARYHQMKFKVARKIRSKVMLTSSCSGDWKMNADEEAKVSLASISGEASSCLSSSSSGISSARSLRYANRCRGVGARVAGMGREPEPKSRHAAGSPHLRRRGEAILKFLSHGDSSEVRIRQMLGDSPDTSKALRMLLKVDAVKRSGSGGRHDPYVYTRLALLYIPVAFAKLFFVDRSLDEASRRYARM